MNFVALNVELGPQAASHYSKRKMRSGDLSTLDILHGFSASLRIISETLFISIIGFLYKPLYNTLFLIC